MEVPTVVTIGTFDGVHLGHQKILNRLAEIRAQTGLRTLVLTFDPHPRKVLFPDQKDLRLLSSVPERLERLKQMGVDVTVVYPFSQAFAETDSAFYIEKVLLRHLQVKFLVIGHDHRFGRNRSGNFAILQNYANRGHFQLEEIPAQDLDQIAISSSKIRKALEEGNLEQANRFLGHPFFITALVVKGKQLGRQLGYPTANLLLEDPEKIIPATGVYFVEVLLNNESRYGMMSIGVNPTTDKDQRVKLEVHVFDFEGDLYHRHLTVKFLKQLRQEERFNSLQELKEQLKRDEESCMSLMAELK